MCVRLCATAAPLLPTHECPPPAAQRHSVGVWSPAGPKGPFLWATPPGFPLGCDPCSNSMASVKPCGPPLGTAYMVCSSRLGVALEGSWAASALWLGVRHHPATSVPCVPATLLLPDCVQEGGHFLSLLLLLVPTWEWAGSSLCRELLHCCDGQLPAGPCAAFGDQPYPGH